MDAAQATMNALYAVNSDNIFVSLLLAAIIPIVARRLHHFFQVTWPQLLHNFLVRKVLYREVSVIEQDGEREDLEMNRMVDNAALIEMILEYVGHLAKRAREQYDRRERRLKNRAAGADDTGPDEDGVMWLPAVKNMANLSHAGFRYAPIPHAKASNSSASSQKKGKVADPYEDEEAGATSDGSDACNQLAQYLRDNFQLTLAPTNEEGMEVEPGLFVRYVRASQSLEEVKEQHRGRLAADNSRDSTQAALTARSVVEDYLLYDLINKLQESGVKRKKYDHRGRRLHHGDDDDDGNTAFITPFGDRGSENEQGDGESSVSHHAAARQQEKVPRQIVLQCRTLRSSEQREAYLRHYYATKTDQQQQQPTAAAGAGAEPSSVAGHYRELQRAAEEERALLPRTRIEAFAVRAREWYTEQISRPSAASLFLYYPAVSEVTVALRQKDGGNDDDCCDIEDRGRGGRAPPRSLAAFMQARRYPIPVAGRSGTGSVNSGGKTFASLFFAQKLRVLRLLGDFDARTGKFAIAGAPHRMTWLVHGPPGTGKTSLVKAMAQLLGRHVVALQLGTIRTNQLLRAWMNEVEVTCEGEEDAHYESYTDDSYQELYTSNKEVRLKPSEVVYLIEDVDAINKVDGLLVDDEGSNGGGTASGKEEGGHGAGSASSAKGSAENTSEDSSSSESESSGSGSASDDDDDDDDYCDEDDEAASQKLRRELKKRQRMERLMTAVFKTLKKDHLSVDGLINALNGVAVPDGRIVVMTTNHPDRLDPRLLHPSVLSLKIDMDDFDAEQAACMIRHYYPEYTARALLPRGATAAEAAAKEVAMAAALRSRVVGLLQRNKRKNNSTPVIKKDPSTDDSDDDDDDEGRGEPAINPARLEQACAECASVEELLVTLETGRFELRDNIF